MKKEELLEYMYRANKSFVLGTFGKQDEAYEEIVMLIKNKQEMTEEWLNEKAREFLAKTNISVQTPEAVKQQLKIIKDFIRKLYEQMPAKKVRVSEEFVKKNRKLLILLIAKMEEEKLLDWTDGGTSLKILEANFENFIKQVLTEAGMEVIE